MQAYIALGSNLNKPLSQIKQAITLLKNHPDLNVLKVSSLYQSRALTLAGSIPQTDYINAVLLLETALVAEDLLTVLQDIEKQQGRVRGKKWSARTLDLDILLFGDKIITTERLLIPHPEMCKRNFVLFPLAEISPSITIPSNGLMSNLLEKLSFDGMIKL
jgi:2-amino-4-hydroxy-6-hydroxymethyldihydropteridine diphosphokinase